MIHIKKNDTVKITAGKDKGKTGKVLKVYPERNRVIVQGVNFAKKHARRTRQDEQGGIIHRESSIDISNIQVVCTGCSRTTRLGFDVLKDGSKVRYCRKCNEAL